MLRPLPYLILALAGALSLHAPAATRPPAAKASAQAKGKASRVASKQRTMGGPRARAPTGVPYAGREDVTRFAREISARRGMDPAWTQDVLARAQRIAVIERLTQPPPPGSRKNWAAYRSRFIEPTRIAAGVRFWQQHREALERAEREYGVPAEIIVGIIGVETLYGQNMGSFRVADALATLSFDHPPHPRLAERTAFFRGELEQFLHLAFQQKADPFLPLGSYAGAMGLPQFMPSSWIRWAVDFDGDGRIDLRASPVDAIGSVANYFKSFGWKKGQPTHYRVSLDGPTPDLETLLAPDILPTFTLERFTALGARIDSPSGGHDGPLALVELQNGDAPVSYVAGTENFYVVTRYNQSSYYAMAVIELGQAVRQALADPGAPIPPSLASSPVTQPPAASAATSNTTPPAAPSAPASAASSAR